MFEESPVLGPLVLTYRRLSSQTRARWQPRALLKRYLWYDAGAVPGSI